MSSSRGTLLSVVVVALACALGWPSTAFAAELMASVVSLASVDATGCPAEDTSALPLEPMCEIIEVDPDADGLFAPAPICDPSGASALAPEPVHPIGNDRLEATPSCDAFVLGHALDVDERHDDRAPRVSATLEPALVPDLLPVPRWWGAVSDAGPAHLLRPCDGVRRRHEHPPYGA